MLDKIEYLCKSMIFQVFNILIACPCLLVFTIRKGWKLYKEDPNNLLDEYLMDKNCDRVNLEFRSEHKIGIIAVRLAEWADASYC